MEFGGSGARDGATNADIVALETAVDDAFETALATMSLDDLGLRICDLHRITTKLDALRAATTDAAEDASLGPRNGVQSTALFVSGHTNTAPVDIRRDRSRTLWLRSFPEIADAYTDGQLSTAHIDAIRKVDNPRSRPHLIQNENLFVEWCARNHFRDLDQIFATWLLGADPDGEQPRDEVANTKASFSNRPGGCSRLTIDLDPLQTAAVKTAVEAEMKKLYSEERQENITRSETQRRAIAVLRLVSRGAARPDGTYSVPLVHVVMSQAVYESTLARLTDPTIEPIEPGRHDPDRRCHLIDGTPIHPRHGLAAAAIGHFRRLVYDTESIPIDVSQTSRQLPQWMRDIHAITTNGLCATPMCDAPFHWLQGDHVTPFSLTNDTRLDDTQNLCGPENLWKTDDPDRCQPPRPESTPGEPPVGRIEEMRHARARVRRLLDEPRVLAR